MREREMVRKCRDSRGIAEITVVEMAAQVGVRTRARALALAAAATASSASPKKRKANNQQLQISAPYLKLKSNRRRVILPENSVSPRPEVNSGHQPVLEDRCLSASSDHAEASCCSSNGSRQRIEFADLKDDESVEVETSTYYSCRESSGDTTTSSELREEEISGELDSAASPSEANSRRRPTSDNKKKMMPTESEIEEFFSEAEKKLQKQFADKYNYDIVKDEPLQGNYEWIQLKPMKK